MCTESELSIITKQLAKIYREHYGKSLKRVYLYGSYARKDNDNESDLDIVAIVDESREQAEKILRKVWDDSFEIAYEYDIVISPMVIPYNEFEKMKDDLPYYRNIAREGVEISA